VTEALTRLTHEANRDIIERYVRWQHLRRMNQMETVPHGTFLRSKQTVTVAINFVNWLHERGVTLEDLQQSDVDAWVAGGPTTRLIADRFLNWAIKNRLACSGLTIPKHRRGTSKKLSAADQETALTEVIDGGDLSSRDRAAAILILVFGQQVEDVVALTWEDVSVTDDLVTITLGGFAIELREPLDAPWRSLAANPGNNLTAAHPNSPWVFRGYSPGQHIHAVSLRDRLRSRLVSTRAARLGTLHELTKLAPAAIIAEALGYSPATIERHAKASGAEYAQYVAAVIDAGPSAVQ